MVPWSHFQPFISVSSSSSRTSVLQDYKDHPSIPCVALLTSIVTILTLQLCCVNVLHWRIKGGYDSIWLIRRWVVFQDDLCCPLCCKQTGLHYYTVKAQWPPFCRTRGVILPVKPCWHQNTVQEHVEGAGREGPATSSSGSILVNTRDTHSDSSISRSIQYTYPTGQKRGNLVRESDSQKGETRPALRTAQCPPSSTVLTGTKQQSSAPCLGDSFPVWEHSSLSPLKNLDLVPVFIPFWCIWMLETL